MNELERVVDAVAEEAQEKVITPSSIANGAYKIEPSDEASPLAKAAAMLTLRQIARDRLRAKYESEQSLQESLAHARALEAYARSRGIID